MNNLYNSDCLVTMDGLIANKVKADLMFTSPPYNRIKKDGE